MKKAITLLIASAMICAAASCSLQNTPTQSNGDQDLVSSEIDIVEPSQTSSETESSTTVSVNSDAASVPFETDPEIQKIIDEYAEDEEYSGIIYIEKDGVVKGTFANGNLENGETVTIDSPMPIGSVSKQFCAAAIMLLNEQGALNIDDTLDMYFPEYPEANKITLKNMLSMRSGIPEIQGDDDPDLVTMDKTDEENTASLEEWLFAKPLNFTPDSDFQYVNSNYFLLANIVEKVTGESYIDFLRNNFFVPLGMTHTGSVSELDSKPDWANGLDYKQLDRQPGLTKGCGDLISNAADISVWIKSLSSGKVLNTDSYKAMTTSYSDNEGMSYGYGLYTEIEGGVGHYGAIGIYSSFDYIREDDSLVMVTLSNSVYPPAMQTFVTDMLSDLP